MVFYFDSDYYQIYEMAKPENIDPACMTWGIKRKEFNSGIPSYGQLSNSEAPASGLTKFDGSQHTHQHRGTLYKTNLELQGS